MSELAGEIDYYLKWLFPICRSVTGNGNRETLRILQEIIPLTMYEVPSSTQVYDWVVPDEWNIDDAWISDSDGKRFVDFNISNLHVVSYSEPIQGKFSWAELQPHLHINEEIPSAIPYRTSYYKRDWGFCVTHRQYHEMELYGGTFDVFIDSILEPGSLTYGELLIPGRSKQEILISCYICHPSMANDSLSGVLLTAFLARNLLERVNRSYSYRIVFVPETIGAITYCAKNEIAMRKIDTGMVITTVGGPGKFGYKQSYDSRHHINQLIVETFNESGVDHITYPFDIHGSDERQYSSQGFRINMATICRDRYYEYPQYHTSLDNLDFVTGEQIFATLKLYILLIDKLENRFICRSIISNCEVMLSKHNLYPHSGGVQLPEIGGQTELDLTLWLLFLCDGKSTLEEISKKLEVEQQALRNLAARLITVGLLEEV